MGSKTSIDVVGFGGAIATVLIYLLGPVWSRFYGGPPDNVTAMAFGTVCICVVAFVLPQHALGKVARRIRRKPWTGVGLPPIEDEDTK